MEPIRNISDDERALLTHTSMFGSDGYPIAKLGKGWTWSFRGLRAPEIYKRKRDAVEAFERFVDVLIDAKGAEAQFNAIRERGKPSELRVRGTLRGGFYLAGHFAFTTGTGRYVVATAAPLKTS